MMASGHPSACFWCMNDFGRKFLVAPWCWLLAGLWHFPFLDVLRANPPISLNSDKLKSSIADEFNKVKQNFI